MAHTDAFAFYHTGGKSGCWIPIPINPEVFQFQKHIDPTHAVVVGTELFFLIDGRTICTMDLFDRKKKRKFINILFNGPYKNEMILMRTNSGAVVVVDRIQKEYCYIINEVVSPWVELESIEKLNATKKVKSIQYALVENNGERNIVIVPPCATDQQYVVSDFYISQMSIIPKAHEVLLSRDKPSDDFKITYVQPGMIQFSLGALNESSDTQYLMIDSDKLNEYIIKTANEANG